MNPTAPPHPPRREGRPESEEEGASHQETPHCIHALYEGEVDGDDDADGVDGNDNAQDEDVCSSSSS